MRYIFIIRSIRISRSRGNSSLTGKSILELCGEWDSDAIAKRKVFVSAGFHSQWGVSNGVR